MKIGIFDSGIGGLSLLHQAMITLPEVDYVFYADVDNVPYGEKTTEQIREYVDRAVDFLVSKGCKAIVLACNTATSAAITFLRNKYQIPIIGIEPAVKPACAHNRGKRIMVVATPVTAKGVKLKNLIMKYDIDSKVDVIALPKLVRFAQQDEFNSAEVMNYLNNQFAGHNFNDYSELVLGCTHFNYFKESYQEIFPNKIEFVDGNEGALRELIRRMEKECDTISVKNGANDAEEFSKTDRVTYYFSGKQISAADQIRIDKYMCQLDRMALI